MKTKKSVKKKVNRKYPTTLTTDEWNFLMELTEYNKMDCWFDLRECKSGYDFVYDRDNNRRISLRRGLRDVAEGMYDEDVKRFRNGLNIWNGLMEKFGLVEHKIK